MSWAPIPHEAHPVGMMMLIGHLPHTTGHSVAAEATYQPSTSGRERLADSNGHSILLATEGEDTIASLVTGEQQQQLRLWLWLSMSRHTNCRAPAPDWPPLLACIVRPATSSAAVCSAACRHRCLQHPARVQPCLPLPCCKHVRAGGSRSGAVDVIRVSGSSAVETVKRVFWPQVGSSRQSPLSSRPCWCSVQA